MICGNKPGECVILAFLIVGMICVLYYNITYIPTYDSCKTEFVLIENDVHYCRLLHYHAYDGAEDECLSNKYRIVQKEICYDANKDSYYRQGFLMKLTNDPSDLDKIREEYENDVA